jgi:T6SS, Transcription factor, DNA binding domain
MRVKPGLDPDVDDQAPTGPDITVYDEEHFVTYLRLLDAQADGADWTEVARIVLHRDPAAEEARTRACWESHLDRARWMTKQGYRRVLEQAVEEARKARPR